MKFIAFIAATLVGASALTPIPTISAASAQERVTRQERVVVTQRRTVTRHNGWRNNNRWRHNNRTRRVCKVTYRNGNRIRRCRTIRVRY
ncbi:MULTISPECIES: hypothetical protein [unclassified Sphingomonas]|uniref:hypothetical protein n=1 Tax=unclassified Sphingomonas TaxID=196159 RepID=UPI000BCECD52|nr:MAG: hypothetical protein B7Z43_02460 [Sphingomonas sp. 12-62-6]OYX39118.1 MAG: hypothetical protein B7Y98_06785 [Sphingomonas sp. 32-62-10]